MVRLSTLATAALTLFHLTQAANLGEVDPQIVNQHNKGSLVVEYFTPDCKRCNDFEPKWNQIVQTHDSAIDFARVNCAVHVKYCKENGMMRLPTLQSRIDAHDWKEYDGDQSLDSLEQFIINTVDSSSVGHSHQKVTNGKVIEISTSEELRQIIDSKEPWFVKFYAPWCGHCKNLAPVWVSMADKLKDKVNVAEVNCDDRRALCSEYRVTGLPTLSFFVHGAKLKYNGARKLKDLVDYAIDMSGSPVHPLHSDDKLAKILQGNDVTLIYVRDTNDQHIDSHLEKTVAPQFMETVPFYTTNNEDTIKRFGLTQDALPAAVLVKDDSFFVYDKDKDTSFERMASWLQKEQYPLVTRVLPHNSNQILRYSDHNVVLGITRPDGQDAEAEAKLRRMAHLHKERHNNDSEQSILFAQLDGHLWRDYLSRVYGIQSHELPALIVLNPKQQLYYDRHANKDKFSFFKDAPERMLETIQALDKLEGTSMAPSKTIMMLDRVLIYFGDHWMLMTTVLVGFLGLFFYLMTREDAELTQPAVEQKENRVKDSANRTPAVSKTTTNNIKNATTNATNNKKD